MFFESGIIYADPHPGNVYVDEEGNVEICDFGMCLGDVDFQVRRMVAELIVGLEDGDRDKVRDVWGKLGMEVVDVETGEINGMDGVWEAAGMQWGGKEGDEVRRRRLRVSKVHGVYAMVQRMEFNIRGLGGGREWEGGKEARKWLEGGRERID